MNRRPSGLPDIPEELREKPKPKETTPRSGLTSLAEGFALGTDLVVSTGVGLGLGWLVDRWLGSSPVGMLLGLGTGMTAALTRLIRRSQPSTRRRNGPSDEG